MNTGAFSVGEVPWLLLLACGGRRVVCLCGAWRVAVVLMRWYWVNFGYVIGLGSCGGVQLRSQIWYLVAGSLGRWLLWVACVAGFVGRGGLVL